MLIVFSGLPGVGETTLAKRLANEISAVYLRVDTIEQAMKDSKITISYDEGYRVAFNLAKENLLLGQTVITDSTNPVIESREAWWHVAEQTKTQCLDIQVLCSDKNEHRNRVESRQSDVPNLILPTWQSANQREYVPWEVQNSRYPVLNIDTANLNEQQAFDKLKIDVRKANIIARM